MNSNNSHILPTKIYSVDGEFPNCIQNENIDIDIETRFIRYFSSNPFNETNLEITPLTHDIFSNSIVSMIDENPFPSIGEISPLFQRFPYIDSFSSSEFSDVLVSTESNSASTEEENFLRRKRSKKRMARMYDCDNMRTKSKRGFLNYTNHQLNDSLKSIGSNKYFRKFPKFFAADVCRERNKDIIDMPLKEIFEKPEIYAKEDENGWSNYWHNLKVVQSEEIKGNNEVQNILNKTFRQLYEEYINSDAFIIDEIKKLKRNKKTGNYIKKFRVVAKHLIQFLSN